MSRRTLNMPAIWHLNTETNCQWHGATECCHISRVNNARCQKSTKWQYTPGDPLCQLLSVHHVVNYHLISRLSLLPHSSSLRPLALDILRSDRRITIRVVSVHLHHFFSPKIVWLLVQLKGEMNCPVWSEAWYKDVYFLSLTQDRKTLVQLWRKPLKIGAVFCFLLLVKPE